MDVRALKDFEKEIRTERNHELEIVSRTYFTCGRISIMGKIRIGYYSWRQLPEDHKKARLFKIIGINSSFGECRGN